MTRFGSERGPFAWKLPPFLLPLTVGSESLTCTAREVAVIRPVSTIRSFALRSCAASSASPRLRTSTPTATPSGAGGGMTTSRSTAP